jgi:hypothetical protein
MTLGRATCILAVGDAARMNHWSGITMQNFISTTT